MFDGSYSWPGGSTGHRSCGDAWRPSCWKPAVGKSCREILRTPFENSFGVAGALGSAAGEDAIEAEVESMSQSHDRTILATPRRREDSETRVGSNRCSIGMACYGGGGFNCTAILVSCDCLGRSRCNQDIQMTDGGRGEQVLLPIVFPTVIVVCLALGVMLLVRTFFDGAVWRLDRIVFDLNGLIQGLGCSVSHPRPLVFGWCFLLLVLLFLPPRRGWWRTHSSLFLLSCHESRSWGRAGGAVMSAAVGYL